MREQTSREVDGRPPVSRFADHLHLVLRGDQRRETGADGGLVVGDYDADHASRRDASSAGTVQSRPLGRTSRVPPSALARSFMPRMPTPRAFAPPFRGATKSFLIETRSRSSP